MKKKITILFMATFVAVMVFAQENSYLRTNKNKVMMNVYTSIGYATGLGDMNDFLSYAPDFAGNFDDMQMLQGGIGWSMDYFFANNWAYYIGIGVSRGNDWAAEDNLHAVMNNWISWVGAEYFFYHNNKLTLSANLCLGMEEIDFDYGAYNGRWTNYTLPVGITLWYERIGFNINYSPSIFRTEPDETPTDMPKMSSNNIDLTLRLAF